MKEIKAYVRVNRIDDVVNALEAAGFDRMTIIDVSALGSLADPKTLEYSIEFVERYAKMAKIELVCTEADVQQIAKIIAGNARTHQHGDGMVIISPVEDAIRIRTGETGETILH